MAKMTLPVWAYEKQERLPDNIDIPPETQKRFTVRLAFERDDRLTTYPSSIMLEFVDEKAAAFFKIGQRYRLNFEPIET